MGTLQELQASLDALDVSIQAAMKRKVDAAALADNALALNNKTATDIIGAAESYANIHINNKDNPHNVTAAKLNVYTKAEVALLMGSYLPQGILPVSRFGKLNGSIVTRHDPIGNTLEISYQEPCILAGIYKLMEPALLPLISGVLFNYVYLRLSGGIFSYVIEATETAESSTNMLIGIAKYRADGAMISLAVFPVTRIDSYRISMTSAGSAIPVSLGSPASPAALAWK